MLKPTTYTYESTYDPEDPILLTVIGTLEVRIYYTWTPMVPARIRYDENDHPPEGDEIEIQRITKQVEGFHSAKATRFIDTSPLEFEILQVWAETLREALIENASEEEESAREAAQEHAYETRRDLESWEP